jgi:hypothetical protein
MWLQDEPVSVPDDDSLHSDLCSIDSVPDSLSRLKLEPKERAVKRIGRSPDSGDALALTFARPVFASEVTKEIMRELRPYYGASTFMGA